MSLGFWQVVIILVIVLLVFGGKGRISSLMSDLGKGIGAFKKGLGEDKKEDNEEETNKINKKDR